MVTQNETTILEISPGSLVSFTYGDEPSRQNPNHPLRRRVGYVEYINKDDYIINVFDYSVPTGAAYRNFYFEEIDEFTQLGVEPDKVAKSGFVTNLCYHMKRVLKLA